MVLHERYSYLLPLQQQTLPHSQAAEASRFRHSKRTSSHPSANSDIVILVLVVDDLLGLIQILVFITHVRRVGQARN